MFQLLALAGDDYDSPLSSAKYEQIEARDGGLFLANGGNKGESYSSILQRVGQEFVEVEASSEMPLELMNILWLPTVHSFGKSA